MFYFEFLASALNIVGAIFMSFSKRDNLKPLYIAFILFYISTLIYIYIFLKNSLLPLVVQMVVFLLSSIRGIYVTSLFKVRDFSFIILSLFIFSYFILNINIKNGLIVYNLNYVEVFASSLAIIGSFLLGSHNVTSRLFAFILFFIADIILAYIGYRHELYGFMIQYIFFLFTSTYGIYNLKLNISK